MLNITFKKIALKFHKHSYLLETHDSFDAVPHRSRIC